MSKGSKVPTKLDSDLKQEDIISAVVVVDDFDGAFHPISFTRPRALMPLANVSLIDYSLEALNEGGVDQVFVYCCTHADLIKKHLKESRWMRVGARMKVTAVVAESCRSIGDVLRDLENKSLIQNDFLLVGADLVTNVNLKSLVEEFKTRKQQSKKAIMTTVYKRAPPDHLTRVAPFDAVLALRTDNQQLVAYQRAGSTRKFRLPLDALDSAGAAAGCMGAIQIRNDLLDCHIAVCSTVVPQLMTDNFDYQSLDDLIRGILVNDEVLDHTLHVNMLKDVEYASSVRDWDTYHATCSDVLSRYVYPFTPDNIVLCGQHESRLIYHSGNIYQHQSVVLDHTASLDHNVSIGPGSHVGTNSVISHSTIGKNCQIGKNVHITRCHIFDNVKIQDGCVLEDSIIDERCDIGAKSRVRSFCCVGSGISVTPGSDLGPCSSYVSKKVVSSLDEGTREKFDVGKLEPAGKVAKDAQVLKRKNMADREGESNQRWFELNMDSDTGFDEESSSDDDDDYPGDTAGSAAAAGMALDDTDGSDIYYNELIGTLKRAVDENIATDNVILEINSVKHAYGVQIRELTMLVTKALLDLPLRSLTDGATSDENLPANPTNIKKYVDAFKTLFKRFQPLFVNYIKTTDSEVFALEAIESFSEQSPVAAGAVQLVVAHLYDRDCLSEEGIMKWWGKVGAERGEVRKKLEKFIEWLKTAEEEDDDDD